MFAYDAAPLRPAHVLDAQPVTRAASSQLGHELAAAVPARAAHDGEGRRLLSRHGDELRRLHDSCQVPSYAA